MTASEQKAKAADIAAELSLVDPPAYSHPNLASALVAALAALRTVEKGSKVDYTTKAGERVNYDYTDIAAVVKATRPVLAAHGLVALTPIHDHGAGLACTVILLHESGDEMSLGPFPFPAGRDAQATGSMVTYHRRYALIAALGMAAGDDDDGAAAIAASRPEPVPQWNEGMTKFEVLNALDGDKTAAAEAWALALEAGTPTYSRDSAHQIADAWKGRPL